MKRVRITIDPGDIPMRSTFHRLTGDEAIERAQIVDWNLADSPTAFLYWIRGAYETFEAELERAEYVVDYELLPQTERECDCFFAGELTPCSREILQLLNQQNLLGIPPVYLNRDGTITLTLVDTQHDIQHAVGAVDERISVVIDEVGGEQVASDSVVGTLSPRQREAIESAVAIGYYDLSRDVVIEDVATELGCTMETAAEHLRKAESKVMCSLFGQPTQ